MEAITSDEFPFVKDLPKREKSKLQLFWDRLAEIRAITREHGQLLPIPFAAALANVSRQRIDGLVDQGLVIKIELQGRPFITENSFVAWAKSERKAGRPLKDVSLREAVRISGEFRSQYRDQK